MRLKKYYALCCLVIGSQVWATDIVIKADTETQAEIQIDTPVFETDDFGLLGLDLKDATNASITTGKTLGYLSSGSNSGALSASDSVSLEHVLGKRLELTVKELDAGSYTIAPAISLATIDETLILDTNVGLADQANMTLTSALSGDGIVRTVGRGNVIVQSSLSNFDGQLYVGNANFLSQHASDFDGFLDIAGGSVAEFKGSLSSPLISIAASGLLKLTPTLSVTVSSPLVGDGALEIAATSGMEVLLTGMNSLGGQISVTQGKLGLAPRAAQGNIAVSSGSHVNFYAGSSSVSGYSSESPIYFTGELSGAGAVNKYGDDWLFLTQTSALPTAGLTIYEGGLGLTEDSLLAGSFEAQAGTSLLLDIQSNAVYTGSITGAGEIIKRGPGILTATTAVMNYGSFRLEDGGLLLSGPSFDSANTGDFTNNGALVVDITAETWFDKRFTGNGTFEKTGSSTLHFTGGVEHSGAFTVSGGTLVLNESSNVSDIQNNAQLHFNIGTGTTLENHGALSGTGSLTKTGTGTLVLDGPEQTYSGGTNITAGTLETYAPVAAGDYDINAGALLRYNMSAGDKTVSGEISGAGDFEKIGPDTLILSGSNSLTGSFRVREFEVRQGQSNTLNSTVSVTLDPTAVFNLNNYAAEFGSLTGSGLIQLGTATLTLGANNASTSYTGVMSGTGGVIKKGTGTFSIGAAQTYTGATRVQAGTISQAAANILTASSALIIDNGATFDLNGFSGRASTLSGGGTLAIGTAAFTYEGVGAPANITFVGNITGTGTLNKNGSGAWRLMPTSTVSFTGQTNINQGTLEYGIANALPITNSIAIASGAFWRLNSNSSTIGQISGAGTIGLGATGVLTLDSSATNSVFDGIIMAGSAANAYSFIKKGVYNLTLSGASTYAGHTQIIDGSIILGNNNALPSTTYLQIGSGANFNTGNYQQSVSKLTGSGTLNLNSGNSGSNNIFTLIGNQTSSFNGALLSNDNAVINVNDTSTLIFTNSSTPSTYTGIINVASGATLEMQNVLINPTIAHASAGHIRSSGNVVLSSTKTKAASEAAPHNIVISGTGAVEMTGEGTSGHITMTAPQIYTGATTISETGTIHYGVNQALPAATAVTINSGATLDMHGYSSTLKGVAGAGTLNFDAGAQLTLTHTDAQSFSGVIDGASSTTINKTGIGNWTLASGAHSKNLSNFNISAGTLTLQGDMSHRLTLSGASTYILDTTGRHYLGDSTNSPDNSSGETIKLGTGSSMTWKGNLFLKQSSTIGRSTTISETPSFNIQGGTLTVDTPSVSYTFNQTSSYGSPALNINSGYNFTINVADASSELSSDLVLTGAGSLIKTGSGALTFTNTQTYTGTTTISGGTVYIPDGVGLSTSTIANNGALVINGTNPATNRTFNFGTTGTGPLTINDATSGSAKILFTNHLNHRGATTINSGRVENTGQITMNANSYIVNPVAHWRLNGATVRLNGNSTLEGIVYADGATKIDTTGATGSDDGSSANFYLAQVATPIKWSATNNSTNTYMNIGAGTTLQLDATARSMELEMDIVGGGSLTKTGAYRAVLSPKNGINYTGATIVNAGTLVLDNKFSKNSTPSAQVASGATLAFRNLRVATEDRSYPNSNPNTNTKLPNISYSIANYNNHATLASGVTPPTGAATDNYIEYSFPISGAGGVRIEEPTVAGNAVYLSGRLSYTGPTTVVRNAFLYVDKNFEATGNVYVDGIMQFYIEDAGPSSFHYIGNNFFSDPTLNAGLIEKYGAGNLILAGDFSGFYGLINIQEGKLFFTDLPPSQIEVIGLANLIARGGSILTITAADTPVEFGGRIIGETNARYRLVGNMQHAPLTVTSLDLDGRIDLRQSYNGINDPRNTDPEHPTTTLTNGIAYETLLQPQFIINQLTVAPRSQFYFQFDQAYTGWAGAEADDMSLRAMGQFNFLNDSIAQYILQGHNDSGLFTNYRYRLLEFSYSTQNDAKVNEIMSLLRAPTIYIVEAQKVYEGPDDNPNKIYLDVIITKRDTSKVLGEVQSDLSPATIGLARQIQGRATSKNLYERNANKVLENAQDPDDLITQINYLTPTGNKKEKEQSEPTANASTGSMAQQTVLNFRQDLFTKKFFKNNKSMSYEQKAFAADAFSHRYDVRKEFNKRLSGHFEKQNFSWAEVFDGLDIFGLSTSLESSYTHVETKDLLNEPGSTISTWSSTLGVSQVLQDKYIVGVIASYSARKIDLKPNTDSKTSRVFEKIRNIGVFAAYQDMDVPYYWATFLSFGNHGYDSTRTWNHPRYDDNRAINEYIPTRAVSTHDGYDISGNIEAGYTFTLSQEVALQPYIGAGFAHLNEPAYREESEPTDPTIQEQAAYLYGNIMHPNLTKMHSRSIGIQGVQSFAIDNTAYQISSRASYIMTKNDGDERVFRYSYLYAPETVNEIVIPNERYHAFEFMFGFNIAYDYQWIVSANYTGSFGNRITSHSIVGTIQYTFW